MQSAETNASSALVRALSITAGVATAAAKLRRTGTDDTNNSNTTATTATKWHQLERLFKRRFSVVTVEQVCETRERCSRVLDSEAMNPKEACRFLDGVRRNIAQSEHTSVLALRQYCAQPLEDVNPYIIPIRDTFCYMAPSWGNRMALFRFTSAQSLQVFGPFSIMRKLSLYLITHKMCELLILVVIVINFVLLAGGDEWQDTFMARLEPIFLAIFTAEATLRIIANGFCLTSYSYMRDVWNVLDLYIILVGAIGMIRERFIISEAAAHLVTVDAVNNATFAATDGVLNNNSSSSSSSNNNNSNDDVNLTGIRVIRVFRAVKVLALFPALRTTVSALGKVIRRLVPAVLLCFLFMWIVALMGIELFGGKSNVALGPGCYHLSSPSLWSSSPSSPSKTMLLTTVEEAAVQLCQQVYNSSSSSTTTTSDRLNINNNGTVAATVPVTVAVARAVVAASGYAATYFDCSDGGDGGVDSSTSSSSSRIVCLDDSGAISLTNFNNFASGMLMALRLVTGDAWEESLSDHMAVVGGITTIFFAPVITFGTLFLLNLILAIVEHEYNSEVVGEQEEAGLSPISAYGTNFDSTFDYHRTIHHLTPFDLTLYTDYGLLLQRMEIVDEHRAIMLPLLQENPLAVADKAIHDSYGKHCAIRVRASLLRQSSQDEQEQRRRRRRLSNVLRTQLQRFRRRLRAITESMIFEFVIVVAILLNTIILCTEHYQQPPVLTRIQDSANTIFTTLFTIECCVKFVAQGATYFHAGWNILDLVVVIISLLDYFLSTVGSLTALRTLRILRIFKLARSWQSMRHLINQTISTLSGIASVAFLLIVVIFIFAIISTEMLSFHNTGRWHFGDFGHSAILVTRIMLGNWLHPLQDCVTAAARGGGSSAANAGTCYAVIVFEMLSGSLLFLNLFLALLLSKFSADVFKHVSSTGGASHSTSTPTVSVTGAGGGGGGRQKACISSAGGGGVADFRSTFEEDPSSASSSDSEATARSRSSSSHHLNASPRRHLMARMSITSGALRAGRPLTMRGGAGGDKRKRASVLENLRAFALGKRVGTRWLTRTRSKRSTQPPPPPLPDTTTSSKSASASKNNTPFASQEEKRCDSNYDSRINTSSSNNSSRDQQHQSAAATPDDVNVAIPALPTSRRRPLRLAQIVTLQRAKQVAAAAEEAAISTNHHRSSSPPVKLKLKAATLLPATADSPRVSLTLAPHGLPPPTLTLALTTPPPLPLSMMTTVVDVDNYDEGVVPVRVRGDPLVNSDIELHDRTYNNDSSNAARLHVPFDADKTPQHKQQARLSVASSCNGSTSGRIYAARTTSNRSSIIEPLDVVRAKEAAAIEQALKAVRHSCAAEIDRENAARAAVVAAARRAHGGSGVAAGSRGNISNRSLPIEVPRTRFGRFFFFAVNHWLYDCAVLLVIFASSVCLVWEVTSDPPKNDGVNTQERTFLIFNCCFTGFFTIEIICNILGRGLRNYFTSGWDLLDLVIVLVSYADLVVTLTAAASADLSTFRILRVLRAFRPLRAVKRWSGMRIVVNALLFSLPGIRDVMLLWIVFWTVFSIVGVQLFAGRLFRCVARNNGQVLPRELVANISQCEAQDAVWSNSMVNFDNVLHGYVAILQIATLEGWEEMSIAGIDSPEEVGEQPVPEGRALAGWIYIFCTILVNGMFVMQLLVGILVEKFQQLKRQYENAGVEYMMSETQKQMIKALKKIIRRRPASAMTSSNRLQQMCTSVALSGRLDAVISVVIIVNMITSSLVHVATQERVISVVNVIEGICTCAYVIEATVKIAGLHCYYFMDAWNCFDFAVTGVSVVGFVTDLTHATSHGASFSLLRTFRLLRVARILRLVRLEIAQDVRTLLAAFVAGLPAVVNVLLLLGLIMFIFCIIGLSQFREPGGGGVFSASHEPALNFNSFTNAMAWLFVLSTGAGWNDALAELSALENRCHNVDVSCPLGIKAVLFVASYVFIVFLLLLNLLVGLVLEAYSNTHQTAHGLAEEDIDSFYHVFNHFDARRKQFIPVSALSEFLSQLEYPLKLKQPNSLAIRQLQVPIRQLEDELGKCRVVHAVDLLETMVRARLGSDVPIPENIKQEIQRKFYEKWPQLLDAHVVSSTFFEPFVVSIRQRLEQSVLFAKPEQRAKIDAIASPPLLTVPFQEDSDDNVVDQLYQLLFAKGANVTIEKLRTMFLLLDAQVDEKTEQRIQRILSEIGGRPVTFVQLSIMCSRHFETLTTDDVDIRNAFLFIAGYRTNNNGNNNDEPLTVEARELLRLFAAVGLPILRKHEMRQILKENFKLRRKSLLTYEDFAKILKSGTIIQQAVELIDTSFADRNASISPLSNSSNSFRRRTVKKSLAAADAVMPRRWDRLTREKTLINARARDSRTQLYSLISNCSLLVAALAVTVGLMFVQT